MEDSSFDIEEYINSLPNNTETIIIIICSKNLTYIPELSRFVNLSYLDCSHNNLVCLPKLPNSLTHLLCNDNKLTYLPELPNSLIHLLCDNNKLTYLPELPNSLTYLNCGKNQLTYLQKLPNSLLVLTCNNNKLTYLPELPNNLKQLYCSNNKLTYLPELPNSLKKLYCGNNQLTNLQKLPNNLIYLNCNNTIIDEIIDVVKNGSLHEDEFNKINKKLHILNKFRELYFALKFKKQFYKLLEKVMIKRYHPSNLIKLLKNVGDDEEKMDILLESW